MGFWHTGYIEFHEPVGLNWHFKPSPPQFSCLHCGQVYPSLDELRKHRFETHPLRRPVMFLDGRELGTQRVRITRPISAAQLRVEGCNHALLNGSTIAVNGLGRALSRISSDVCRVVLSKDGVEAEFELEIRVASEKDLSGVEDQFKRMARSRRLDMRAIDEFISSTNRFGSAIGYCDGICAYLYGLLAKERAQDSSLPYEAYSAKFAKAAEELAPYDRGLARIIGGVIEFHFNHFRDSARLSPGSRVARVASRYANWMECRRNSIAPQDFHEQASALEALVTDWETEQIIRWGISPLADLAKQTEDVEEFLKRDLPEFDKVKLHVLLGEAYAAAGRPDFALRHAKTLRNLAAMEEWAESVIRDIGE